MKTFDFGLYIVTYNFVIGLLLMMASEKFGVYAGYFMGSYKEKTARLVRIGILTLGGAVAVLSGSILLAGYILKL